MANQRDRERRDQGMVSARDWAKQSARGEVTCVKLPEGYDFYKPGIGIHTVDYMLYVVGEGNPNAKPGFWHCERSYVAHRIQTPTGTRWFACREKCFGEACAACDWLREYGGSADPELVRSVRPVSRHLWLVNDKPGDERNQLKIHDTNHAAKKKGFGEQMTAAIQTLDEGVEPFAPQGGYKAVLTVEEDTFPGGKYNLVTRIDLRPRTYDYSDAVVTAAPCLDEMIVDLGYEAVHRHLVVGGSSNRTAPATDAKRDAPPPAAAPRAEARRDTREPASERDAPRNNNHEDRASEPAPVRGRGGRTKTAEDYGIELESWVSYKGEDCQVIKISPDGSTLKLEGPDEMYSNVPPEDVKLLPTRREGEPAPAAEPEPRGRARTSEREPSREPARSRSARDEEPLDEPDDAPRGRRR